MTFNYAAKSNIVKMGRNSGWAPLGCSYLNNQAIESVSSCERTVLRVAFTSFQKIIFRYKMCSKQNVNLLASICSTALRIEKIFLDRRKTA